MPHNRSTFTLPLKKSTRFTLPTILFAALTACGGGGGSSGDSNNISIKGSINTADFPLAQRNDGWQILTQWLGLKTAWAQTVRSVDTLVAIPSDAGNIDAGVYRLIKTTEIDAEGSFDLTLTKEYDWVLLLVNSQALTADQKVVAYVTVPASVSVAEDGSLIDLPFSSVTGSEINLGRLSATTTAMEARSDQGAESLEASLSLSLDDLKKYAKYDDVYQHFANVYLNYNAASGEYYFPTVEWNWQGLENDTLGSDFTDPANFSPSASNPSTTWIETNNTALPFSKVCDSSIELGLFPPQTVTISQQTFSPDNGILNQAMAQGNSGFPYCYNDNMSVQTSPDNATLSLTYPVTASEGMWRLKADGSQLAQFEFSLAAPYGKNGNPLHFVPLIRINHDRQQADKIVSIDIKWQQYDEASAGYIDVADDALTDKLVAQSFIGIVDYSTAAAGQDVSFLRYDNNGLLSGNITLDGDYQWHQGNTTGSDPANGIAHVTDISVSYQQGGISYRFTWGEKT